MDIRILGLCGSLRPDSVSRAALDLALVACADLGAQTDRLDPGTLDLPFCTGTFDPDNYPAAQRPAVAALRQAVLQADGLILASPEYHGGLSGVLKNALDLLPMTATQGKVCALMVAAGGRGGEQTLGQLRLIGRSMMLWPIPHQVAISGTSLASIGGEPLADPEVHQRIAALARELVRATRLHRLGAAVGDGLLTEANCQ